MMLSLAQGHICAASSDKRSKSGGEKHLEDCTAPIFQVGRASLTICAFEKKHLAFGQ